MPKVTCPLCEGVFEVEDDDLFTYGNFYCEECGVLLEVIEEEPLKLAVAEDDEDLDIDEDDEDYL